MKGYLYTMFPGADPGVGWHMTDPIFRKVPTIGACMPNIRRLVLPGDYIFVVSGNVPKVRQYVVGGMKVAEKIDALAAYRRFPENRLKEIDNGALSGNIIVNLEGKKHPLDYHSNFAKRVENYIIGADPVVLEKPNEIELGREQTLDTLQRVFQKKGKRVFDVIGRWRKLDPKQIEDMLVWLADVKENATNAKGIRP